MYHITIKKEVDKKVHIKRQWTLLEMEYDGKGQEKPRNGYTPEETEITTVEIVVLDQMVDELNLPLVIAAVNGLELRVSIPSN